jgi:D-alanyl-D-alanine carboxypeptidase
MHEQGLAIDFTNCGNHVTACWQWLNQDAGRFDLKNLPSEPWHWSITGR